MEDQMNSSTDETKSGIQFRRQVTGCRRTSPADMNQLNCLIGLIATLLELTAYRVSAAPPANDDFINRIEVQGTDILLGAVMEGSTLESIHDPNSGQISYEAYPWFFELNCSELSPGLQLGSVWWT